MRQNWSRVRYTLPPLAHGLYIDKSKNQAFLLSNMYYWFTSYFIIGDTSKTVKYALFSRMEVFRFLNKESLKIEVMKTRLWF